MHSAAELRELALWALGGAACSGIAGAVLTAGNEIFVEDNQEVYKEVLTALLGCAIMGTPIGVVAALLKFLPRNDPTRYQLFPAIFLFLAAGPLLGNSLLQGKGTKATGTWPYGLTGELMIGLAAVVTCVVGQVASAVKKTRHPHLVFFSSRDSANAQNGVEIENLASERVIGSNNV